MSMPRTPRQDVRPKEKVFLDQNYSLIWASLFIDQLVKSGLSAFYFCPGMRNAPLALALMNNPKAQIFLGPDERSMSYRALGHAKITCRPVAILCTSGSALANMFPAVIEAHKSDVPLLVISADRPPQEVQLNANQCIEQTHLLNAFWRFETSFETHLAQGPIQSTLTQLSFSLQAMQNLGPGPVHFNLPFEAPVDQTAQAVEENFLKDALEIFHQESAYARLSFCHKGLEPADLEALTQLLLKAKNPLMVVGQLSQGDDGPRLKEFLSLWPMALYADVTTRAKFQMSAADNLWPSFDHPEVASFWQENPPDLVLHLGGKTVSKNYYKVQRKWPKSTTVILVNPQLSSNDPGLCVNWRLALSASDLAINLQVHLKGLEKNLRQQEGLKKIQAQIQNKASTIDQGPWSTPLLSKTLVELLDEGSFLYLGNSTVVRSFDACYGQQNKDITVLAHRGASGIEGFISAGLGACEALGLKADLKPVTLVLGDISFLHDLNALIHLADLKHPLIIVLINNSGGGIFSLLPGPKDDSLLECIASPHSIEFEPLIKAMGLDYFSATLPEEFVKAYQVAKKQLRVSIIEAKILQENDQELYKKLKTRE